jgi:hypothetical protein
LAGLLEIADDSFSNLNNKIIQSKNLNETYLLKYLETPFIQQIRCEYDHEFSYNNLNILLPLLQFYSTDEFEGEMNSFLTQNYEKIGLILKERESERTHVPYLTQPEIFLIFYLIDRNIHKLKEKWEEKLYLQDLEKLCTWWGDPLDPLYED